MMTYRKQTEAYLFSFLDEVTGAKNNTAFYKEKLGAMTDKEFDVWMKDIKSGKEKIIVNMPHFKDEKFDINKMKALAKKIGLKLFQKVDVYSNALEGYYRSKYEILILLLPVKRNAQTIASKMAAPKHTRTRDMLSGQAAGDSRSGGLSYTEINILSALGGDNMLKELISIRGGDVAGAMAMNNIITREGHASIKDIEPFSEGPRSKVFISTFMTGMHIEVNL